MGALLFPRTSIPAYDYANVAMGGRSIPALTSPPYSPPLHLDISHMDRTFWRFFSPKPPIHPPEMALSDGNNPGECWAFAGTSGQLGIQLLQPIHVISFAIEHTWNMLFTKSAPRKIMLWGLVPEVNPSLDPSTMLRPFLPQFEVSYINIHLATVTFDPIQTQPHQTFLLPHTTRRPFDHLIAQFLGNWGHSDYTCLYRLEIHGSETG
jgi:SUN domain-containing protein 1/2